MANKDCGSRKTGIHKATPSLPFSAGQRRERIMKGPWVKIRQGDHSSVPVMGTTDSTQGN